MALRYVGTSPWERTIVDDDGKFVKSVRVLPGEEVSDFVDDDGEQKILSAPRFMRSFVETNGPEDKYGDNYGNNRWDVQGNATQYPELDMGSTVQPRRAIFRTPDDNEEGFDLAGPQDGPRSDNADAILRNEAQVKADEAYADARKAQSSSKSGNPRTTAVPTKQVVSGDAGKTDKDNDK